MNQKEFEMKQSWLSLHNGGRKKKYVKHLSPGMR